MFSHFKYLQGQHKLESQATCCPLAMGSAGQDYTTNKLCQVHLQFLSNPLVHFNTGEVNRI